MAKPVIGIVMGSDSDMNVMEVAANTIKDFEVPFELTVVSAHRTPLRLVEYAKQAAERGLKVLIAGAGGAAHLPGMLASITILPVIGVPVKSSNSIDGWDSVLSILQMPAGVPVATVALNGAKNAALLALQIIALSDGAVAKKLEQFKKDMEASVMSKAETLQIQGWPNKFDKL